jgi:DNA-binding NtrC family response regulator
MNRAIRVVMVDEDEDILEATHEALRQHGYCVDGYGDAAAAAVTLSSGPDADVLLLDCLIGQGGGTELFHSLAHQKSGPAVVLFSAATRVLRELGSQAAGVVEKPCGVDELLRVIDRVAFERCLGRAPKGLAKISARADLVGIAPQAA